MQRRPKRFYVILATAVTLAAVIGAASLNWYFNQDRYGPGPVDIEVTTDKSFYMLGENVTAEIYVTNPQDWPVPHPNFDGTGIEKDGTIIEGGGLHIDFGPNIPTFPPHSKTLYKTYHWDQKTGIVSNRTLVQPGNYTLIVDLSGYGYDSSTNCTIEIRP